MEGIREEGCRMLDLLVESFNHSDNLREVHLGQSRFRVLELERPRLQQIACTMMLRDFLFESFRLYLGLLFRSVQLSPQIFDHFLQLTVVLPQFTQLAFQTPTVLPRSWRIGT
jgi:hypothetical protein